MKFLKIILLSLTILLVGQTSNAGYSDKDQCEGNQEVKNLGWLPFDRMEIFYLQGMKYCLFYNETTDNVKNTAWKGENIPAVFTIINLTEDSLKCALLQKQLK